MHFPFPYPFDMHYDIGKKKVQEDFLCFGIHICTAVSPETAMPSRKIWFLPQFPEGLTASVLRIILIWIIRTNRMLFYWTIQHTTTPYMRSAINMPDVSISTGESKWGCSHTLHPWMHRLPKAIPSILLSVPPMSFMAQILTIRVFMKDAVRKTAILNISNPYLKISHVIRILMYTAILTMLYATVQTKIKTTAIKSLLMSLTKSSASWLPEEKALRLTQPVLNMD